MIYTCRVCKEDISPNAMNWLILSDYCSTTCKTLEKSLEYAGPDEMIRLITFIRTGVDTGKNNHNEYAVTALAENLIGFLKNVRGSSERKAASDA
jgi:succinate dehydrogenase/fumarate reductase-like Fe-S protein